MKTTQVKEKDRPQNVEPTDQAALGTLLKENRELRQLVGILKKSRNKLTTVFDSLNEAIISFTPDARVESVNHYMAQTAGMHPRDLAVLDVGQALKLTGMRDEWLELCLIEIETFLQTGEGSHLKLDGKGWPDERFIELDILPVRDDDGSLQLGIAHFRDVTTFKCMEMTIREYSETLEEKVALRTRDLLRAKEDLLVERESLAKANRHLLELEQLRHDLTNMVVHDLKGPLAEVMGNLDILHYGELDGMQKEAVDLAYLGADDLLRMIMNLLDIDRLEESRLRIKPEPVRFEESALAMLAKFKTLINLKGMRVSIDDDSGEGFEADPDLLVRVLQNLFTNALDHTPEGGSIVLGAKPRGSAAVLLWVKDSGCGIPEKYHDRIFKKFSQAGGGSGPRTSTGLGLTFCKMAVEAHGGDIWFESAEGEGATFFVKLPVSQA